MLLTRDPLLSLMLLSVCVHVCVCRRGSANITSIALQRSPVTGATVLHMGTQAGLVTADITPSSATPTTPLHPSQWVWSYRYLQRWTVGEVVVSVAAHDQGSGSPYVFVSTVGGVVPPSRVTSGGPMSGSSRGRGSAGKGRSSGQRASAFRRPEAISGCGVALLEDQSWTLAAKAERMEAVQSRHNRHGLVADCSLPTFGDSSGCTNHDSDNNGL